MEIPNPAADVRFSYGDIKWNPPLPQGVFQQMSQRGLKQQPVDCQ
jgi:hypothetical protein